MGGGGLTWGSLSYAPVVAAAGVACVAVVVGAYRSQLRGAGWYWRWGVPGFRALAVVALLVSALRPSVLRPAAAENLGAVVVVVDDSASMSVADSSWTPAELVEMADGLGEMPAGVARWKGREVEGRVGRVRPLIDEAARAASELEYARVAGRAVEAAGRRAAQTRSALVAACRGVESGAAGMPATVRAAMQWGDVGAVLDAKGRAAWGELRGHVDAAVKAIRAYQAEADAKLYAEDAGVRAACDGLARETRVGLARRVIERVLVPGLPAGVPVRVVAASDPTKVAWAAGAGTTRPVVGGIEADKVGVDLAGAIRAVTSERGQAVRAVVVFSDGRRGDVQGVAGGPVVIACRCVPGVVRDVGIRRVSVPQVVYAGDQVIVGVDLTASGYAGRPVVVRVAVGDAVVTGKAVIDGDRASVGVPVRFGSGGVAKVMVNVEPLAGEATETNNSAERYVRVSKDRAEVIAFAAGDEGDAGALRAVLAQVPGVSVKVVGAGGATEPAVDAGELVKGRVVILDDVSVVAMSGGQLDAVREAVADRGGTLVLVAGRSHWPLDAESEALLDEFLPYRATGGPVWRVGSGRAAKGVVAEGEAMAAALPGVGRYLQLGELREGFRVLVTGQESGAPLVVEGALGQGRVLTVAVDDMVARGGAGDAARFWGALLRYAAGAPYAVESGGYGLDTDRVDVEPGGAVRVRVKTPAGRSGAESRGPMVVVLSDGRVLRSTALAPAGGGVDGRFEAELGNLAAGGYVLRLDPGAEDEVAPVLEVPLHVRSGEEDEMADVSGDERFLARLSEPTGGEVIPVTEPGRVVADVERGDRPKVIGYALWDSPYLFLFVTACLGAEWGLRKRLGLA